MYLFWTELIYQIYRPKKIIRKKYIALILGETIYVTIQPKRTNGPSEQNCKIEDYCLDW
jgi:hypothetical protein